MITEAYEKLSRVKGLAMYPIFFDLTAFIIGLAIVGFHGTSKFTLKFSLNTGLPSISNVVDQSLMANGMIFSTNGAAIPAVMILAFIVFLPLGSFIQGGFIGLLYNLVFVSETVSFREFMNYGKKYWLRFLILQLIIMAVLILGILLAIVLSIIGALLFLIGFFILRIHYIYWEFTIVVEDLSVREAFIKSREYFTNRVSDTVSIILSIIGLNLLFGILVNSMWNPVVFFISILAYGYLASGLQIALMMSLQQISINQLD